MAVGTEKELSNWVSHYCGPALVWQKETRKKEGKEEREQKKTADIERLAGYEEEMKEGGGMAVYIGVGRMGAK